MTSGQVSRSATYKRKYERLKNAGLCVVCQRPVEDRRYVSCIACRKKKNEYARTHEKRRY